MQDRLERDIQRLMAGNVPERYRANMSALSIDEQLALLRSEVALVGLGGLGGHVLELLVRAGVGSIVGCDGDVFEDSNLNRQLLADAQTVGTAKASAATRRVELVNPDIRFMALSAFLDEDRMREFFVGADVAVDALGGLADRPALLRAASDNDIPAVTAAVAGFSGYVATVLPGAPGPADLFGTGPADEDRLGVPGPAVAFAASVQAAEILRVLRGKEPRLAGRMLVFDLERMNVETVQL